MIKKITTPCFLSFLLIYMLVGLHATVAQQRIVVLEIKSAVDPVTNRYIQLALKSAKQHKVDMVIIEMDTYGGVIHDADAMRTQLLSCSIPTYVLVNKNAISAGALIALSCDHIYMTAGASIGAATVVNGQGEVASDKYQSCMSSMMRATAEATSRNPYIAEAMVGKKTEHGRDVLTLTANEAIKHGFCEGIVEDIPTLLEKCGVKNYAITYFQLDIIEKIIAFFLTPFVSGFLILIIIGGLYLEFQTPGIGIPLLSSLLATALYCIPYYLHGLVGNLEIVLMIVGVLFLLLEFLVIPGIIILALLGVLSIGSSLTIIMLNNQGIDFTFVSWEMIIQAITVVLGSFVMAIILFFIVGLRIGNRKFLQSAILDDVQDAVQGYTVAQHNSKLIGKIGKTYSVLRPSGKVIIEHIVYDAQSLHGIYIDQKIPIEVVDTVGTLLVVQPAFS